MVFPGIGKSVVCVVFYTPNCLMLKTSDICRKETQNLDFLKIDCDDCDEIFLKNVPSKDTQKI